MNNAIRKFEAVTLERHRPQPLFPAVSDLLPFLNSVHHESRPWNTDHTHKRRKLSLLFIFSMS